MKKNNLYHVLQYFAIAGGLLLAGCNQEMEISPEAQNRNNLQIKLTPDFAREVEVKSVNGVDENAIYNVWVIQLKGDDVLTGTDGNRLARNFSGENLKDGEDYSKIINTTIDVTADKVYFIANTPSNVSFSNVTNKTDIEALLMDDVTGESSLAGGNGIVMSGAWKAGGDKAITEGVDMHRAIAKVSLTVQADLYNSAESFALTSVRVMKVPGQLQYFRDPDECIIKENSAAYPALTSIAQDTFSYAPEPATDMQPLWTDENLSWMPTAGIQGKELTSEVTEKFWWYLPENARGKGTGTTQEEKDGKHAPDGQNGEYCTYILVKGYYKHYNGLVSEVDYKIYLGENNINDYNIIRNTHYQVTATIKSASAVDTRINEVTPQNYIDYTDNSMPWAVFAASNDSPKDWNSLECPDGWAIPSQKEMMLAWIYDLGKQGLTPEFCWTGQQNVDKTGRWYIQMTTGETKLATSENGQIPTYTLVTSKSINGLKYPYVQQGEDGRYIIVSRDENGGVKEKYVRNSSIYNGNNWMEGTPQHTEQSQDNIVAAKFEIAERGVQGNDSRMTWEKARHYCATELADYDGGGWRMPTQRELMLMYVMNDQLPEEFKLITETDQHNEADPNTDDYHVFYWSATEDLTQGSASSQNGWSVCFCADVENGSQPGKTEGYNKTATNYIRCVRDVLDNE